MSSGRFWNSSPSTKHSNLKFHEILDSELALLAGISLTNQLKLIEITYRSNFDVKSTLSHFLTFAEFAVDMSCWAKHVGKAESLYGSLSFATFLTWLRFKRLPKNWIELRYMQLTSRNFETMLWIFRENHLIESLTYPLMKWNWVRWIYFCTFSGTFNTVLTQPLASENNFVAINSLTFLIPFYCYSQEHEQFRICHVKSTWQSFPLN